MDCPYAKSDMTPCFIRDGDVVIVKDAEREICVGCERGIDRLRKELEASK